LDAASDTGNIGITVGVAAPVAYFSFSGAKHAFLGTLHAQGRDAVRRYTESKIVITRCKTGDGGTGTGVGR
jgi:malonate-semialdehyde dehydrogenase (acetylating) / methylmalonate-semialdehyde dehydrogenase